jgi:hypothetical protein
MKHCPMDRQGLSQLAGPLHGGRIHLVRDAELDVVVMALPLTWLRAGPKCLGSDQVNSLKFLSSIGREGTIQALEAVFCP